jgi:hypothetical protein
MISFVTDSVFLVLNYGMFQRILFVNKCVNHYEAYYAYLFHK